MKERPIPYSIPMVIARRDGRKTQTRRVIDFGGARFGMPNPGLHKELTRTSIFEGRFSASFDDIALYHCPYGQPGDRLWNREPWKTEACFDHLKPSELPSDARIWYLADGPAPGWCGRYRHARFMPRRFSRGLDEVVSIRVERLQDISEADAIAEGVEPAKTRGGLWKDYLADPMDGFWTDAYGSYSSLWESINGPGSFDSRWVWVVEFRVIDGRVAA